MPIAYWPPEAVQYPKDDVVNTLEVYHAIIGAPAKNLHDVAFQSHVAFCLHLGAINGLRTALHQLNHGALDPQGLHRAIGKATRGVTAIKRMAQTTVEG